MNLKFIPMAAIAAMTLFTACSDDNNDPTPDSNSDSEEETEGYYSSALFTAEANHNTINYSFSGFFSNTYIGTISGGADMPSVNSFFTAAAYQGAVQEGNDWTSGWTLLTEEGDDNKIDQTAVETLTGTLEADKTLAALH